MTLERGTLLHKRYRIVEILGQGGMGSIYRAVDENLGVEVAVKDNFFTTEEYARQFRLEAVILASLRHTNLPRVTDHFVIGEQGQYLIMDYIDGEDLRQRMERQGTISEQDTILIGVAICDALQYLHSRKPSIVHRDVKPGNVKISPEGHIYLVDFGLAKITRGNQATTTGARAMTPGYSPPEQYGTARTDPRTDIYSLGATLYAALTGVIPEDGLARAMDNVALTPVRKRNQKISRRLAQVVEKAMAVHPEDRFQTAEEFKQGLLSSNVKTQKLESEIVVKLPPQDIEQKRKETLEHPNTPGHINLLPPPELPPEPPAGHKRGKGFWFFFSIFLLAILATLVVFRMPISKAVFNQIDPPTSETPIGLGSLAATMTSRPVSLGTSTPTLRPTNTLYPTDAPIPSVTLTLTSTLNPMGTLASLDTPITTEMLLTSLTPLPSLIPTTQMLSPTATSLGGGYSQIVFVSSRLGQPQIFLMNSDGSDQRQVTDLPAGACQPDWSPDGTQLVFISPCPDRSDTYPGSHLFTMDVDGSGITPLPSPSDAGDFDPAWSPDGVHIAFTSLRDGYPQIYIQDLSNNSVTRMVMTTNIQEARQPAWSPSGTQIVYTVKRVGVLQVWVMSDVGADQVQLVRSGSDYFDFLPVWSSDGQYVVFTQSGGILTIGWLMSIRFEQRETQNAAPVRNGAYAIDAEYSPDGQWIIFESLLDSGNYNIALMRVDGTDRLDLTADPSADFDASWRPSTP